MIDPSIEKRLYAQEYTDDKAPVGKFNSTTIEQILCAHQTDPNIYTTDLLAQLYKIDPEAMCKLLTAFRTLHVNVIQGT